MAESNTTNNDQFYENYKKQILTKDIKNSKFIDMASSSNNVPVTLIVFLNYTTVNFNDVKGVISFQYICALKIDGLKDPFYIIVNLNDLVSKHNENTLPETLIENKHYQFTNYFDSLEPDLFNYYDIFQYTADCNFYNTLNTVNFIEFETFFFKNIITVLHKIAHNFFVKYISNKSVLFKSKLTFLILNNNDKIINFPFWHSWRGLIDWDAKIIERKGRFSKLQLTLNEPAIEVIFINFRESFIFQEIEHKAVLVFNDLLLFNFIDYYTNLDYVRYNLLRYALHWLRLVKSFKVLTSEDDSFKKHLSLPKDLNFWDFTSIKNFGWYCFINYLKHNNYSFRNVYSPEEQNVFESSTFLGIQNIDFYNQKDWEAIKLNFNNITNWDDFEKLTPNTIALNEYDINSAYSCAASQITYSNIGYFENKLSVDELWKKDGFLFVTIYDDNLNKNIYLPVKNIITKTVHYNMGGILYGWYHIEELLQIKDYVTIDIHDAYLFNKPHTILNNLVKSFNSIRDLTTMHKPEVKIALNSIFGSFNFKRKKLIVTTDELSNKDYMTEYKVISTTKLSNKLYDSRLEFNQTNHKSKYFQLYALITIKNRINLRNYLFNLQEKNHKIGLINVDSFWTDAVLETNTLMGGLKLKNSNKKVIFISQTKYLNITDKYLVYCNKKIYDFNQIKVLLKDDLFNIQPNEKININFKDNFNNVNKVLKDSIKNIKISNNKKPTTNKAKNNYNTDLDKMLQYSQTYLQFKNIIDINSLVETEEFMSYSIENKLPINDFTLELNTCSLFYISVRLYLYVDGEESNNLLFNVQLDRNNWDKNILNIYEKFNAIIFNWFEAYEEDYYSIKMDITYSFNKHKITIKRILK